MERDSSQPEERENEVMQDEMFQYCQANIHLLKGKTFQVVFMGANAHLPADEHL